MKKKLNFIQNVDNLNRESERKKQILTSATKIIGEKGFQNATIAEIAKEAGIGDATIYEYFKNKEDLLLAIPVETTKDLIAQINDHMMGIKGAFNKLRKFIWWWLNYVEKNPGYGVVVLLELKTSKSYVSTDAYQAARNFYQIILDIIKEGQEEEAIKKEINPYLARSLCVGAMEHIIIRWLLKDKKYSLIQYADELADLLIDSLRKTDFDISKTMVSASK
jgi:TetR/AcrR family transcriptional regulator, fatty acid metabolism regulator protein